LLAQADKHLEVVAPRLVAGIERRLAVARWQSRAVRTAAGLAAAAVLTVGVLLSLHRPEPAPITDTVEQPPVVPVDHKSPSQQLAVLVASHCGSACPSPHRWTRLPRIPTPTPWAGGAPASRSLGDDEPSAQPSDDPSASQAIVLRSPTDGASCIQARRTLGARKVAEAVFR
jgi:hypothetical protein